MAGRAHNGDVRFAWRHALFWLMAGNGVGLWLSLLLLFPGLNLGELTYGRILPLHLNFQLYGWSSLPLIAWLLDVFPARSEADVCLGRGAVLAWSLAVATGGYSWLMGMNNGKIFLEWEGLPRVALPMAMLFLWVVLAGRFLAHRHWVKGTGLVALLPVPLLWYWASSRYVYPAVNPETSGPTGASLLGSTLVVVLLLLVLAPALGKTNKTPLLPWAVFGMQMLLFALATKSNTSHRSAEQIGILGSLLFWLLLLPYYFRAFEFSQSSKLWLHAALAWFGLLILTGWLSFLPQVLDGLKFTNGLVAHSHLAMAGFVTSLNLFIGTTILPWSASRSAFWHWNGATAGFVLIMWIAGWFESRDPAFTILPNITGAVLYGGRTLAGFVLLGCAAIWWMREETA
jgi:cytochrome c oxidase cbb3-type subunit 1